ncbi:MAG: DUF479 domain-containing protein [Flavobacterium sp.]|nr:MAG: DUF479 domain-containing protein [Flavobacterium sp.]
MNFLAHIYLSGNDPLVRIGNFMADGIRGKEFENFPEKIRQGIILHRAIDTFTDMHPVFRRGTKRLHPQFHHYAGVIMDVFYDHFLANNWDRYCEMSLTDYAAAFYQSLEQNRNVITQKTSNLLPYMIKENWLVSYASTEGISKILSRMDARTSNRSQMRFAPDALLRDYDQYETEFTEFFEDVRVMAAGKLASLK